MDEITRKLIAALTAFVEPWNKGGEWQTKITYDTYNNARSILQEVREKLEVSK